jgi:hypothetical protein
MFIPEFKIGLKNGIFLVSLDSLEVSAPFLFICFLKYRHFHVELSNTGIRRSAVSLY